MIIRLQIIIRENWYFFIVDISTPRIRSSQPIRRNWRIHLCMLLVFLMSDIRVREI